MELKFAFFILTKTRRHCINSARFGNEVANKIRGLIFFAANWRMLWLAFWFRLRKESFSRAQEKFSAKGKRPRRPSGARRMFLRRMSVPCKKCFLAEAFFLRLTAMRSPEDTAEMLHEMATVGTSMAFLLTAVWAAACGLIYIFGKGRKNALCA